MSDLYNSLATCHPKIERGQVRCKKCGETLKVDPAFCFRYGWPKHCGETMTLDSPKERKGEF
jgi:hypothetical protein